MRVAHLLRKLDPAEWGGTETALQRLFDGLHAQGISSVIYCPRVIEAGPEDPLVKAGHRVQRFKAFVPIVGLSRQRRRQLIAVGGNLMSLDLVRSLWGEQNLSLIHTHALGRIGGIARTIASRRRIPLVVTIHGGVLDLPAKLKQCFNAPSDGWEWGKLFGLVLRSHRLFEDADALLTCNAREAELLRERFPHKRIVVQPHSVPMELYRQDHRAAACAAFPQIVNRQVLLCVGRIDPVKNQLWLLEQAPNFLQQHPETFLVLAGPCTDEPYGERVRQKIQELGIGPSVLLTGGLPSTDPRLLGLMQQARLLLLPSLSETFGLVILEGWAAGTPTLASRTSGPSALVEQGRNGWLFDLEKPETFHKTLATGLSQPDLLRDMARLGAEKVAREYSVVSISERIKRIYEELIEQKQCAT